MIKKIAKKCSKIAKKCIKNSKNGYKRNKNSLKQPKNGQKRSKSAQNASKIAKKRSQSASELQRTDNMAAPVPCKAFAWLQYPMAAHGRGCAACNDKYVLGQWLVLSVVSVKCV